MKKFIVSALLSVFSFSTFASSTLVYCETNSSAAKQSIFKLTINDLKEFSQPTYGLSSYSTDSVRFTYNDDEFELLKVDAYQGRHGVNRITVLVDIDSKKYTFSFKGLDASSCFGNYGNLNRAPSLEWLEGYFGEEEELVCKCQRKSYMD